MSFDPVAPHYRWMEAVLAGDQLQRCRTAQVAAVGTPCRILLAGEGHGRFLGDCLTRFPKAQILCVDSSPGMLRVARRRNRVTEKPDGRVTFRIDDLRTWEPPEAAFDLVVTQFVLDCFRPPELPEVIARLSRAATPSAHWLQADFQIAATGWRRWRCRIIHRLMYAVFRRLTRLPAGHWTDPDPWLIRGGFRLATRRTLGAGLIRSDLWHRGPVALA